MKLNNKQVTRIAEILVYIILLWKLFEILLVIRSSATIFLLNPYVFTQLFLLILVFGIATYIVISFLKMWRED